MCVCVCMSFRFLGSVVCDTVTVSAIKSDHKVSTYKLLALASKRHQPKEQVKVEQRFDHAPQDRSSTKEQKETLTDGISGKSTAIQICVC